MVLQQIFESITVIEEQMFLLSAKSQPFNIVKVECYIRKRNLDLEKKMAVLEII